MGKSCLERKYWAYFQIKDLIAYIEVFGGAGWVLFSREKHASLEVYNDVNGELVNLFRQ